MILLPEPYFNIIEDVAAKRLEWLYENVDW